MESNERYYARRAVEELRAADRAVTAEAKARRRALAEAFQQKAQAHKNCPAVPIDRADLSSRTDALISISIG
ncbi:MAG TPA: hypothetical protein VEA60_06995 [Allosphingosinicella sp.]|nr:hypothetical protein [Allosphingosinicella sp.]